MPWSPCSANPTESPLTIGEAIPTRTRSPTIRWRSSTTPMRSPRFAATILIPSVFHDDIFTSSANQAHSRSIRWNLRRCGSHSIDHGHDSRRAFKTSSCRKRPVAMTTSFVTWPESFAAKRNWNGIRHMTSPSTRRCCWQRYAGRLKADSLRSRPAPATDAEQMPSVALSLSQRESIHPQDLVWDRRATLG